VLKADNFTVICQPIAQKMWDPRRFTTPWVSTACYRDDFTFLFSFIIKHYWILKGWQGFTQIKFSIWCIEHYIVLPRITCFCLDSGTNYNVPLCVSSGLTYSIACCTLCWKLNTADRSYSTHQTERFGRHLLRGRRDGGRLAWFNTELWHRYQLSQTMFPNPMKPPER
jgi:hypothetical protein